MPNELNNEAPGTERRVGMHAVWYVAIVLALAGNVYLLVNTSRLGASIKDVQKNVGAQIAEVNQNIAATNVQVQDRLQALSADTSRETRAAVAQARAEARKGNARVTAELARQQTEVAGQLSDLKDAANTADSKLTAVSGDVSSVKADVASTQTELQKTGSDLRRVMGDMGVMSGLIATNSKDLDALRALGERNYFEFDIRKNTAPHKVAGIGITLRKADPKRSRFTLDVLADDRTVQKKDRTINEPIQFYVSGSHRPYEIVINKVSKNEVAGYLSTPKVKMASR
jgi:hypothetical protein